MDWTWWLGAALVAVVVEMFVLDFVLLMLAVSAVVAALLAFLGAPLWLQVLGFAVTSAILLRALRPWLLRNLKKRVPLEETNVSALVGRLAVALASTDERGGQVKLAGEVWSARTEEDVRVDVGDEVRVLRIEGATVVVTPRTDRSTAASAGAPPDAVDRTAPSARTAPDDRTPPPDLPDGDPPRTGGTDHRPGAST